MSDYRIDIKVKNNNLMSRIEKKGYVSVADFCKKNKMNPTTIGRYLNLKESPISKDGNFKEYIIKLADLLDCLPEDLFSTSQLHCALESNKRHMIANEAEIELMLESMRPVDLIEYVAGKELENNVQEVLESLTLKEKQLINKRYGLNGEDEHNLEQLAEFYNVTRERVRQIESKALRKMRHPSRNLKLKELYFGVDKINSIDRRFIDENMENKKLTNN